jgi:hypothetical protein
VEVEDSQNAMGRSVESGEISQQDLKLEVGAIRALRQRGVPPDPWPVPISTAAERLRYALLVEDERRLVEYAERLGSASAKRDEESWLQLLCSALTFSIHVVEFKLDTPARQAARLLNAENVLGVALVVRSMLEHHAVAVELGKKLTTIWERIERAAPTDERLAAVLGDAEKQVARVLAGNPESQEKSAAWRGLWESTVRKYHVLESVGSDSFSSSLQKRGPY